MYVSINKGSLSENELCNLLKDIAEKAKLPEHLRKKAYFIYEDARIPMSPRTFIEFEQMAEAIQHVFDCVRIYHGCLILMEPKHLASYVCFTHKPITSEMIEEIISNFNCSMREYFHRMRTAYGQAFKT
jgi:hypothetical protein